MESNKDKDVSFPPYKEGDYGRLATFLITGEAEYRNPDGKTKTERRAQLEGWDRQFVIRQLDWYEPGKTYRQLSDQEAIERVLYWEFEVRAERR